MIGLSAAMAIARLKIRVILVGNPQPGEASFAAAGMLAPSVERATGPAHDFAVAARDRYPEWLAELTDSTGIAVPLNRAGVLQVAITPAGVKGLRKTAPAASQWLDRDELSRIEPMLTHALGAIHNPSDGAVDNIRLLAALNRFAATSECVTQIRATVTSVSPRSRDVTIVLESGDTICAGAAVIAAGAWGARIAGVPHVGSITPVRGQIVRFASVGLEHVVYGPRGYLVPRANESTIAGSTMEHAGFDASTTAAGIAKVVAAAEEIAPVMKATAVQSSWAGLRPVTPDGLPLLGTLTEQPSLIYSIGHSRNGILLAALSGDVVASLVSGAPILHDLSQFRPDRF